MPFQHVHGEQHVAFLIAAGKKVAVAHVRAEAKEEQENAQQVPRPRRRFALGHVSTHRQSEYPHRAEARARRDRACAPTG